jgi:hypothetical protein
LVDKLYEISASTQSPGLVSLDNHVSGVTARWSLAEYRSWLVATHDKAEGTWGDDGKADLPSVHLSALLADLEKRGFSHEEQSRAIAKLDEIRPKYEKQDRRQVLKNANKRANNARSRQFYRLVRGLREHMRLRFPLRLK